PAQDIIYQQSERLPFHANGMQCQAMSNGKKLASTYYSVGGGFVVKEGEEESQDNEVKLPYPTEFPTDLQRHCEQQDFLIADMVQANEQSWQTKEAVSSRLLEIWQVMKEGLYRGCHTDGILPGGLEVRRRARSINAKLLNGEDAKDVDTWIQLIRANTYNFRDVLKWVS
ncbi:unnamed protein product, partial [Laminaria digitata]